MLAARRSDPDALVWRGDISVRVEEQGVTVLGTPMGHPAFVRSQLAAVSEKHDQLISQILGVTDLHVLGSCCSIALQPGRTTCCMWCIRVWLQGSRPITMRLSAEL